MPIALPTNSGPLTEQATAIRALGKQTAANIVEIGQRLVECKRIVGHGHFGEWLKKEFEWSERSARRYMQVAELPETAKLAVLDISSLSTLAAPSTPAKARDEVIKTATTLKSTDVVKLDQQSKAEAAPTSVRLAIKQAPAPASAPKLLSISHAEATSTSARSHLSGLLPRLGAARDDDDELLHAALEVGPDEVRRAITKLELVLVVMADRDAALSQTKLH